MKMRKVYDIDNANDDGQLTNFDKKSSLESSAQWAKEWEKKYIVESTTTIGIYVRGMQE